MSQVNKGRIDPSNPPSADQSQTANNHWFAYPSDVTGAGYFVDNDPNQAAKDADARAHVQDGVNPYTGPGLDAVITEIQPNNQKAKDALLQESGNSMDVYQATVNKNAQADPTWNNSLSQVARGGDPEAVFMQAGTNAIFTLDKLKAAKVRLDALA